MLKTNLTTEMINKKGSMSISVLALDCPLEKIAHFGMQSGRTKEKFADIAFEKDHQGNPYILDGVIARFSCRVEQTMDLGSHYLFVCSVEDCQVTGQQEPITYAEYRKRKSGAAPAKQEASGAAAPAPTGPGRWVCSICHYVYDGEIPFEELPPDWACPVCKRGKEVFIREN
jgi:flavin reductase (DIM6/NTAB) family NADH-FMN oxidoreductase RutF/rubredoxin